MPGTKGPLKELLVKEVKNLIIEPTNKTPLIDLNSLSGDMILSGRSIPENTALVYEPVLDWVNEYAKDARPTTNFRINLEYFNTSSSIWIAKILKVLGKIDNPDYTIIIHLYFSIIDFEEMDIEELKDELIPITDIMFDAIPSIGIKIYGTNDEGKILKDTLVFI